MWWGHTLVERLSGVRTQSGVVAAEGTRRRAVTLVKPPCMRGNADRAPSFELYALQLRKNHGKLSVRLAEKCQMGIIQLVDGAAVLAASTHSVTFDTLGLSFR